jgi:hypothetical protein
LSFGLVVVVVEPGGTGGTPEGAYRRPPRHRPSPTIAAIQADDFGVPDERTETRIRASTRVGLAVKITRNRSGVENGVTVSLVADPCGSASNHRAGRLVAADCGGRIARRSERRRHDTGPSGGAARGQGCHGRGNWSCHFGAAGNRRLDSREARSRGSHPLRFLSSPIVIGDFPEINNEAGFFPESCYRQKTVANSARNRDISATDSRPGRIFPSTPGRDSPAHRPNVY